MRKADKELNQYLTSFAKMMDKMKSNHGYYYKSLYHFGVEEFKYYKSEHLTIEEKSYVMKAVKGLGFEPQVKQCFYNSQLLMTHDYDGRIKYVEGYAVNIIPTLHGWCEINGKLIDVTWKNDRKEYVFGDFPRNRAYAGVIFPPKYVTRSLYKLGFAGTLIEDYHRDFPVMKNKWDGGRNLIVK